MLLPTTYTAAMLALAATALFWGVWANTQRAAGKWRFELYSFDFAIGALATALLLAVTLGNAGSSSSFTFEDSLTVASKRSMAVAMGGGAIFGLGNTMILAGVVLAGMSTALPVAASVALLTAVAAHAMGGGPANPALVYGGAGAALAAVIFGAFAQRAAAAGSPVIKGMHRGWKGFILSCIGGLAAGASLPIVESSRAGDLGIGAFGAVVFLTAGLALITPLVNVYFLNLPVQGEAGSPRAYLKGTAKQHVLGLAGGALWAAGATALFAAAGGMYAGAPAFLSLEALGYGGAVAGALCGLIVWSEQAGAPKARTMLLGTLALLAAGATLTFLGA
ncbi:MAG: hypothetical protein ACKV2U_08475 [Bryobacteraceae bacterium]